MPSFEQIKRFYSLGLWTKTMVRKAVEKGVLTWMEYEEIVGEYKLVQHSDKYGLS